MSMNCPSFSTHGLQGHRQADRPADRRGKSENVGGEVNARDLDRNDFLLCCVLRDDTALALDILADILTESSFDEEELEREKHVILQEIGAATIRRRRGLRPLADNRLSRPDDRAAILGTPDTVAIPSPPDRYAPILPGNYTTDRMFVVAAGAVDHDAIRQTGKRFAAIPQRPTLLPVMEPALTRVAISARRAISWTRNPARLRGPRLPCARLLCLAGSGQHPRRRHVVTALPGSARNPRALLFGLCLPLGFLGHRHFRHPRRDGC